MLHTIRFEPDGITIQAQTGDRLIDVARAAGLDLNIPCGGQGRCGRCAVIVQSGHVRRRSTLRLSAADVAAGYALACQTIIEGDAVVTIPPQEKIERVLTTGRIAPPVELPFVYDPARDQPIQVIAVQLDPPSYDDNLDDWGRVQRALAQVGIANATADLDLLRGLSRRLRQANWNATCVVELDTWDRPGPPRVIDLLPALTPGPSPTLRERGEKPARSIYGLAIDIGTTSNVVYLVDLITGKVIDQAAEYNRQIARGEDVISRIVFASKNGGLDELQRLVTDTLNLLIERLLRRHHLTPEDVVKATVAGNSTMTHLFLALPPETIRLSPFVTTINHPPTVYARAIGLNIHPRATIDCLPGVASYLGADITAGVLSSGLSEAPELTLFMDIGTNGEMVLGNDSWLIGCACSAGPAFEGAGILHGMRATAGAIEEVWINSDTHEPTLRVIGGESQRPRGLCGSGLIALVSELSVTGIIDKAGHLQPDPRVRSGEHGPEFVVAWGSETEDGRDIVLTAPDIDNLLRAKAAIFAGIRSLTTAVGVDLADVSQVLIGGAFGQYLNIEKAIQIGLLPDLPWERYKFLGNTSVMGATRALLSRSERKRIEDIARRLTYLELSADNRFYDEFTSALFLPHTNEALFPSVTRMSRRDTETQKEKG